MLNKTENTVRKSTGFDYARY